MRAEEFFSCYAKSLDDSRQSVRILSRRFVDIRKVSLCQILRNQKDSAMSSDLFQQSIDMVSEFAELCSERISLSEVEVGYDPYIDDSITLFFRDKKARINLYYNELSEPNSDNYDEVYFSFMKEGKSYLVNDTLKNIMPLINYILE